MKQYYVYILSNLSRRLYVGVTNDLERRVYEHKNKSFEGFSKKYNLTFLVYYEIFNDIFKLRVENVIPSEPCTRGDEESGARKTWLQNARRAPIQIRFLDCVPMSTSGLRSE
jgi:hypothetical protein